MVESGQVFAARYRVARGNAAGGMEAIFEALRITTERGVARELLFPQGMSVASALELEAEISARVDSRFVVEILDAGFDEAAKSPVLVMALLELQTPGAFVRSRGPLGVDEALPLLEQLAAGLDAAHEDEAGGVSKPIVHRDLKPENPFLSQEHELLLLEILDFGIANVLGESCNVSQEVRGAPLDMAFEQVTAPMLSPQTAVRALGLIAYFTLTGQSYWRSAKDPSANVQSSFAEILSLPLVAPSERLRQQGSSVVLPSELDGWLLTCLEREPTRQHASASAAVEALARALGRAPRTRTRFSSLPAPALSLAAPDTTPEPPPFSPVALWAAAEPERVSAPLPPPTPELAAAPAVTVRPAQDTSLDRSVGEAPVANPSKTGSSPAIASGRFATPTPGRGRPRHRLVSASAVAALLTGSLLWLAVGGRGAGDAGAGASSPPLEAPVLPVRAEAMQLSPKPAARSKRAVVLAPDEPFIPAPLPGSHARHAREPAVVATPGGPALAKAASARPNVSPGALPGDERPRVELPLPEPRIRAAQAARFGAP